jgi:hypothetical protein
MYVVLYLLEKTGQAIHVMLLTRIRSWFIPNIPLLAILGLDASMSGPPLKSIDLDTMNDRVAQHSESWAW